MVIAFTCTNSAYIYNDCCGGCGYSFSTKDELQDAVDDILDDVETAENKYGIINCWDVSKITDMCEIFSELSLDYNDYNEPIECWDVSSVTNMYGMFMWA